MPQQHAHAAEVLYTKFDYPTTGVFNPPMTTPQQHPFDKLISKYQAVKIITSRNKSLTYFKQQTEGCKERQEGQRKEVVYQAKG